MDDMLAVWSVCQMADCWDDAKADRLAVWWDDSTVVLKDAYWGGLWVDLMAATLVVRRVACWDASRAVWKVFSKADHLAVC